MISDLAFASAQSVNEAGDLIKRQALKKFEALNLLLDQKGAEILGFYDFLAVDAEFPLKIRNNDRRRFLQAALEGGLSAFDRGIHHLAAFGVDARVHNRGAQHGDGFADGHNRSSGHHSTLFRSLMMVRTMVSEPFDCRSGR